MLFVLGVGSTVGLMNNISTNLKDHFPKVKYWLFAGVCSVCGFALGLTYVTEGGIHVLELVDYFGGEFLIFTLATIELIAIVWIYGLQNICWDVEFMLKRKLSAYWRVCWGVIMPCFMLLISGFIVARMKNPKYDNESKDFPLLALVGGWTLFAIGCSQVALCAGYLYLTRKRSEKESFLGFLLAPNVNWGPKSSKLRAEWQQFKSEKLQQQKSMIVKEGHSWMTQKWWELMGKY
jgi:solute carrier family 6 amino acid transporter-like protein 5/7/9/14